MKRASPLPTPRQIAVLRFVAWQIALNSYAPTVREVSAFFGWTAKGAHDHLLALARKGLLLREGHTQRALSLTDAGRRVIAAEAIRLPAEASPPGSRAA